MKWTKEEINICIDLVKQGINYKEISKIVNRSERSIRCKLHINGESQSKYRISIFSKCLNCEFEFESNSWEDRKFCSHSCSAVFNNRLRASKNEKNCKKCGCIIHGKNKKFCKKECNLLYKKELITSEIENGTLLHSNTYKRHLISKFGEKCMECGWDKINPKTNKVPIQLEHIDGNSDNNNLENLKLLCPNCHSLTPTYGALNKGSGRKNRKR